MWSINFHPVLINWLYFLFQLIKASQITVWQYVMQNHHSEEGLGNRGITLSFFSLPRCYSNVIDVMVMPLKNRFKSSFNILSHSLSPLKSTINNVFFLIQEDRSSKSSTEFCAENYVNFQYRIKLTAWPLITRCDIHSN